MNEPILCLHDIPLFKGLTRDEFSHFCAVSKKINLTKGDSLFTQDDEFKAVYVIKSGSLKLIRLTESGEEIIVKIVGTFEALGENLLFRDHAIQEVTAMALEPCEICSLNKFDFESVIENNPYLSKNIIKSLGTALSDTWLNSAEFFSNTTYDKVYALLISLSKKNGVSHPSGILIDLKITQTDIASMIGASRVMVSQVLKKLNDDHKIKTYHRKYIILNQNIPQ